MDPKQQAQNYDQIAYHWNSNNFNRENGIKQHKRAFQYAKKGGIAIDIGCGSSGRIISLLIQQGYETQGLDYSREMLKMAQERHPNVAFHYANICEYEFTQHYDFISAWDSVWHVPLSNQKDMLRKLLNALSVGGVIIFTSGAVDEPGEVSNPCFGQELYHAALGIPTILKILDECDCVCRHLENDDWPSKHLYIIAQRVEKISTKSLQE